MRRVLVAALTIAAVLPSTRGDDGVEFFEHKIRPILVDNCYSCHSSAPDAKIKGGLLLDTKATTLKGGDTGPAIVPGDLEKSLMIKAVRYADENLQMPPKKKLSSEQVALLEQWVTMGAPDPRTGAATPTVSAIEESSKKHWAFQPVSKPAIPAVKNKRWVKDDLDAFLLQKLEAQGISPAPQADKRTLIRRATFDLTGLPPTPEDVETFLKDKSKDAFAKVVDRLLSSSQYGERWARHWLDVARYADTKGYVFEEERRYPFSYTYRDYVINAFNQDLPYNRFLIEQIAADKLDLGEDKRALAAMGYLTLGRRFLNNPHDIIDDRIDVVTRGMLGLTVTCARCHDHKYDPVPTKDYYSLYGVFASSFEPEDKPLLGNDIRPPQYDEYVKERDKRTGEYEDFKNTKHQETLTKLRKTIGDYLLAAYDTEALEDKSKSEGIARERKLDPGMVRKWSAKIKDAKEKNDPILEPWIVLSAVGTNDFAAGITEAASKLKSVSSLNSTLLERLLAEPLPTSRKEVAERYNKAFAAIDDEWKELNKKAAEAKSEAPKGLGEEPKEQLRKFAYAAPLDADFEEIRRLLDVPDIQRVRALKRKVDELDAVHPGAPPRAMAMLDKDRPQNPRVFVRGNPNNPGPETPRQFLAVLTPGERKPFTKGSGRLELAEAIANPDNPLTARVMVNRVWLHHFGAGLVRTPSDFGLRSDPPTHPELLDHLASQFVAEGWSLKKLHRHMMLSSAYQQSSVNDDPKAAEQDPINLLVHKMNRRRLEFEAMRDTMLAVAGQLDLTAGGHSVEISGDGYAKRRSVYGIIERQNLPAMFRTFDLASPDSTSPQRFATTVPQQALFMMNSPFSIDQARQLANRPEVQSAKTAEEKVRRMYQIAFQRAPERDELKLAAEFLKRSDIVSEERHPIWQYGYGKVDADSKKLVGFTKLPHHTGDQWQGSGAMPDPAIGWVSLNARGGHPGKAEYAAIRRWTAPQDCVIEIVGTLSHESKDGDGVWGLIISSAKGTLADWTVQSRKQEAKIGRVEVKQGETIDFVVASLANENSDSFQWEPTLRAKADDGAVVTRWSARSDFSGNQESWKTLNPLETYAQVLLVSNELMFVD